MAAAALADASAPTVVDVVPVAIFAAAIALFNVVTSIGVSTTTGETGAAEVLPSARPFVMK